MTETLELDTEIAAYEQMKPELMKNHLGKFVIIHVRFHLADQANSNLNNSKLHLMLHALL